MLLIRQIVRAIEAKSDHSVPEEFFHDLLDEQFTEEVTLRQLETAISWGRYAELFDFDAARRQVHPARNDGFRLRRRSRLGDRRVNPLHTGFSYSRGRDTLARSLVLRRTWPVVMDLCVAAIGLAVFYAIVRIAMFWAGPPSEQMVVSLSPRALPQYAFYSVVRIFLAYVLSLIFAVSYGYLAAYNKRVEPFMIATLDILQSIPVLSFLPPVMLAMIALFPTRHFGVELGAIVLLFTGAVWNMAFSFYSSLKSIPRELREAADINRFSWLQRLVQLELPYAAIGLVWNSIMSVAGAWFTLMACEMFHFGTKDFRLPGLGSYLQTAADLKDDPRYRLGSRRHDRHHRGHRPADLASSHRLERQVQV